LASLFYSSHTKKRNSQFFLTLPDRNQTDSRRFKPNSCTVLFDEQSNPSNLLQLEDTTSRHRGHKQKRRFDRLVFIILLSLEYLLSVWQPPCYSEEVGSLKPTFVTARSINLTVRQAYTFTRHSGIFRLSSPLHFFVTI